MERGHVALVTGLTGATPHPLIPEGLNPLHFYTGFPTLVTIPSSKPKPPHSDKAATAPSELKQTVPPKTPPTILGSSGCATSAKVYPLKKKNTDSEKEEHGQPQKEPCITQIFVAG